MHKLGAMMNLRQRIEPDDERPGPFARLVTALNARHISAFSVLMLPFHILFAVIMLATPRAHVAASPVYSKLTEALPIEFWAIGLIFMSACVLVGILRRRWMLARIGYVLMAAWWFLIGGLVYSAATTLLSPSVYVLIALTCLYRQAEIAVGAEHGWE